MAACKPCQQFVRQLHLLREAGWNPNSPHARLVLDKPPDVAFGTEPLLLYRSMFARMPCVFAPTGDPQPPLATDLARPAPGVQRWPDHPDPDVQKWDPPPRAERCDGVDPVSRLGLDACKTLNPKPVYPPLILPIPHGPPQISQHGEPSPAGVASFSTQAVLQRSAAQRSMAQPSGPQPYTSPAAASCGLGLGQRSALLLRAGTTRPPCFARLAHAQSAGKRAAQPGNPEIPGSDLPTDPNLPQPTVSAASQHAQPDQQAQHAERAQRGQPAQRNLQEQHPYMYPAVDDAKAGSGQPSWKLHSKKYTVPEEEALEEAALPSELPCVDCPAVPAADLKPPDPDPGSEPMHKYTLEEDMQRKAEELARSGSINPSEGVHAHYELYGEFVRTTTADGTVLEYRFRPPQLIAYPNTYATDPDLDPVKALVHAKVEDDPLTLVPKPVWPYVDEMPNVPLPGREFEAQFIRPAYHTLAAAAAAGTPAAGSRSSMRSRRSRPSSLGRIGVLLNQQAVALHTAAPSGAAGSAGDQPTPAVVRKSSSDCYAPERVFDPNDDCWPKPIGDYGEDLYYIDSSLIWTARSAATYANPAGRHSTVRAAQVAGAARTAGYTSARQQGRRGMQAPVSDRGHGSYFTAAAEPAGVSAKRVAGMHAGPAEPAEPAWLQDPGYPPEPPPRPAHQAHPMPGPWEPSLVPTPPDPKSASTQPSVDMLSPNTANWPAAESPMTEHDAPAPPYWNVDADVWSDVDEVLDVAAAAEVAQLEEVVVREDPFWGTPVVVDRGPPKTEPQFSEPAHTTLDVADVQELNIYTQHVRRVDEVHDTAELFATNPAAERNSDGKPLYRSVELDLGP